MSGRGSARQGCPKVKMRDGAGDCLLIHYPRDFWFCADVDYLWFIKLTLARGEKQTKHFAGRDSHLLEKGRPWCEQK